MSADSGKGQRLTAAYSCDPMMAGSVYQLWGLLVVVVVFVWCWILKYVISVFTFFCNVQF
jgi:hypothetical protein